ncbi:hypothetical protein [Maribacter aquivivus]|nr:hypothetical protein [Maribacter aquivivus]
MKCKLCGLDKVPKSNTHYLTDFVIRTALNEDGSKLRGKGSYWSIDPNKATVDYKFQQEISIPNLENLLGRQSTEEENLDAEENIDFTVSDSFCQQCEDIFTKIEDEFASKIIQKFRDTNLNGIDQIELNKNDSQILRLFFLLQFWRTSECDDTFKLSKELSELLRNKILERDKEDLDKIAMSVTYLQTLKDDNDEDPGEKFKTENMIAPVEGTNPTIIIMNDFIIQLYENTDFPFESFYGYNEKSNYIEFINYEKDTFSVKIISNDNRKKILYKINHKSVKHILSNQAELFIKKYSDKFKAQPTNEQIAGCIKKLSTIEDIMKFSEEKLNSFMTEYIDKTYM